MTILGLGIVLILSTSYHRAGNLVIESAYFTTGVPVSIEAKISLSTPIDIKMYDRPRVVGTWYRPKLSGPVFTDGKDAKHLFFGVYPHVSSVINVTGKPDLKEVKPVDPPTEKQVGTALFAPYEKVTIRYEYEVKE